MWRKIKTRIIMILQHPLIRMFFYAQREVVKVKNRKLTEKQKSFVSEYLIDLNATQAAVRAGFSKNNADKIGSQLLGKTSVSQEIQKAMQNRSYRTEITQDKVIKALASIGFADIDIEALKPADKLKALELLMKHLGMFNDNQQNASDIEDLTPLSEMLGDNDDEDTEN